MLLAGLRPCLLRGILASVLPLARLPPFLPLLFTRTGVCLDTALDSFPIILAQVYMWLVRWLKRCAADTCPLLSTQPAPTILSLRPSPTAPAITDSQSAVSAPIMADVMPDDSPIRDTPGVGARNTVDLYVP